MLLTCVPVQRYKRCNSSGGILNKAVFFSVIMIGANAFAQTDSTLVSDITIKGMNISSNVQQSSGLAIKKSEMGHAGGYLIGSPLKSMLKGGSDTNISVLQISLGGPSTPDFYSGTPVLATTDQLEIAQRFQELVPNEMYIFEYKYISGSNFGVEGAPYQVTGIHTLDEFVEKRSVNEISNEIRSGDKHKGKYAQGVRNGRIRSVMRTGRLDTFCSIELNVGGLTDGKDAAIQLTVLDEEVCAYAENTIALNADVAVSFEQDYMETWNPSSLYCKGIKILAPKEEEPAAEQLSELKSN